jgi:hypothetical protein
MLKDLNNPNNVRTCRVNGDQFCVEVLSNEGIVIGEYTYIEKFYYGLVNIKKRKITSLKSLYFRTNTPPTEDSYPDAPSELVNFNLVGSKLGPKLGPPAFQVTNPFDPIRPEFVNIPEDVEESENISSQSFIGVLTDQIDENLPVYIIYKNILLNYLNK